MNDQIKKLVNDEAFVEKLSGLSSKAEIHQAFAEKNMQLTDDEVDFIYKTIITHELPDDALENVAGGSLGSAILNITDGVIEIGTAIFKFFSNRKNKR
ncbi:MAG: hypothetical protein NC041_04665 [Bacteroides sp.]|nr:hypothetical protein [Prevotella sp.]MCM1407252.1 hypothetical protein [Treponema brennaborense]MCM1469740.1 hypothetical protein [Bacteroides sp.]